MGMYSWRCKGCGHELISREIVNLDGITQEYNGYGGSVENGTPSAWHQRCYDKANKEEKLDNTPSMFAPNQGFGPAKLEFLDKYDESAPTNYSVVLNTYFYNDNEHGEFEFHYTNDNKLEDLKAYEKRFDEVIKDIGINVKEMDDYESWEKMPEEEKQKLYDARSLAIDNAIGIKNPFKNRKIFSSIDEAIATIDNLLPDCLPEKVNGEYDIVVYGEQGKNTGAVYQRTSSKYSEYGAEILKELEVKEIYRIGNPVLEYQKYQKNRLLSVFNFYEKALASLDAVIKPFNLDDIMLRLKHETQLIREKIKDE